MRKLLITMFAGMLVVFTCTCYAQSGPVDHFHKAIISPYIQVTFIEGDQERVTINQAIVDTGKLHVEVKDGTLRLYLDGVKDIPHNQRDEDNQSHPLYPNHAVIATVVYKKLDALSLRGEETYLCESPISQDEFTLRVYGESKVIFTEVHIGEMHTTIYGESSLDVKTGTINKQYYTCYGESKINTTTITGQEARITAYGEAELKVNVSDRIKITSFGEAKLRYMGNPVISKGIHFGGVDLQKIE
ncbi:GIN domain-containing protein [Deminuibacter soli]|uniref:DUF2807 domain-containing protein n=1 Tax=Deminuibacter soli TaxID=2291815 RepID=A0A3E1NLA7_9BACT|nr:DUF2807 domain-containing protein [Deminuibacter soli]RFM28719.1 DUF2807 domain-containing protein [Deminuibacter soli]